ncbi:MAG: Uma2 family endonuclease [Tepidiformaceae bacterium]
MPVTEETYKRLSLEDDEDKWELVCGHLRRKPGMTHSHADVATQLVVILARQLDRRAFRVRENNSRTRVQAGTYFIPDIAVVPYALTGPKLGSPDDELETYTQPLPFVAEIWSKSTADYDVTDKLPEYQRRADLEIWFIHPYDRKATIWRRRPDGTYSREDFSSGVVSVASLPNVHIDLAELFDY